MVLWRETRWCQVSGAVIDHRRSADSRLVLDFCVFVTVWGNMKKLEASSRSVLTQQLRLRNRLQAFYFPPKSRVHISAGGFEIKRLWLKSGPAPSAGAFWECSPAHSGVTTWVCAGASNELTWSPELSQSDELQLFGLRLHRSAKSDSYSAGKRKREVLQPATRGPLRCLGLAENVHQRCVINQLDQFKVVS